MLNVLSNPGIIFRKKSEFMPKLKDLTGNKIERLLILYRVANTGKRRTSWYAKCDCGNECVVATDDLTSGDTRSCGCLQKDLLRIDLLGQRFGKLLVVDYAPKRGKAKSQFWKCHCDCGNEYIANAQHLSTCRIQSCGCWLEKNISQETKDRFFSKVDKTDTCWNWKGALSSNGYGMFFHTKMIRASRFSYILHHGDIEEGKIICHHCDNPKCVNPLHIYAGDHKQNAWDRETRGRVRKRHKSLIVR